MVEPNELPESLSAEEQLDAHLDTLNAGVEDEPGISSPPPAEAQEVADPDKKVGFDDPSHPEHERFKELQDKKHEAEKRADQIELERQQAMQTAAYYQALAEQQAQSPAPATQGQEPPIETVEDFRRVTKQDTREIVQELIQPIQQQSAQAILQSQAREVMTKDPNFDLMGEINKANIHNPQMVQIANSSPNPPETFYRLHQANNVENIKKKAVEDYLAEQKATQQKKTTTQVPGASAAVASRSQSDLRKAAIKKVSQGKMNSDVLLDFLPTPYDNEEQ